MREATVRNIENFTNMVALTVKAGGTTRALAGSIFNRSDVRLVRIGAYHIEVMPSPYMLVCLYADQPGVIGRVPEARGRCAVSVVINAMPLYEFFCSRCHKKFEELCASGMEVAACPSCAGESRRVLSTFRTNRGHTAIGGGSSSAGGCGG